MSKSPSGMYFKILLRELVFVYVKPSFDPEFGEKKAKQ